MKTLTLSIPGKPFSKQSARSRIVWPKGAEMMKGSELKKKVFVSHYQAADIKNSEKKVRLHIKSQLPLGWVPHDGPIVIENLIFSFPLVSGLKAHERREALAGRMVPKDTQPDVQDNLMKGCIDAMEGLVFTNDGKIVGVRSTLKCYWKKPGTFIRMAFFDDRADYYDYITRETAKGILQTEDP